MTDDRFAALNQYGQAGQAGQGNPYMGTYTSTSFGGFATPTPTKELGMFSEMARDIKMFILEHRSIIYFIAAALIVDHLIFKDVFRDRLQAIVAGIIKKVENKVNAS